MGPVARQMREDDTLIKAQITRQIIIIECYIMVLYVQNLYIIIICKYMTLYYNIIVCIILCSIYFKKFLTKIETTKYMHKQ
jgi:hypothetical protein